MADTEGQLYITINFEGREKCTDIENRLVLAEGAGQGKEGMGVWDQQRQIVIQSMNKQQDPTVQHRELYSIFYDHNRKENGKEHICVYIHIYVCITESLYRKN